MKSLRGLSLDGVHFWHVQIQAEIMNTFVGHLEAWNGLLNPSWLNGSRHSFAASYESRSMSYRSILYERGVIPICTSTIVICDFQFCLNQEVNTFPTTVNNGKYVTSWSFPPRLVKHWGSSAWNWTTPPFTRGPWLPTLELLACCCVFSLIGSNCEWVYTFVSW